MSVKKEKLFEPQASFFLLANVTVFSQVYGRYGLLLLCDQAK